MPRGSRQRGFVGINGADDDDAVEMDVNSDKEPHPNRRSKRHKERMFWKWGSILLLLASICVAAAALAYAMSDDAHWQFVSGERIVSRHDGADVEVKEGGDLVVHNSIIDSFEHIVYEKIVLNPLFGPTGPDLLFGAANATYARLQAFFAVGFRVWDRSFIPIGGVFDSAGLFGEAGLAVAFDTFVNWFHGPIVGTGPGILIISDANAKENVASLDAGVALGMISKLEPRSFDWKGAASGAASKLPVKMRNGMKGVHGFVAQEVGAVIPSAVHNTHDYLPEGTSLPPQALMDYNALIVELVGATQSLWANGVTTAGRALMAVGPPADSRIADCFNTEVYPTQRETARCVCETQRCGQASESRPDQQCRDVDNACGGERKG